MWKERERNSSYFPKFPNEQTNNKYSSIICIINELSKVPFFFNKYLIKYLENSRAHWKQTTNWHPMKRLIFPTTIERRWNRATVVLKGRLTKLRGTRRISRRGERFRRKASLHRTGSFLAYSCKGRRMKWTGRRANRSNYTPPLQ